MNLKNLLARFTLLVAMIAFLSGSSFATDRYVNSTDGNDVAFNGLSAGSPFRTIEKAISVAAADDIIHVAAGTYAEAAVDMDVDLTFIVEVFQNSQTAIINNGIIIDADVAFTGSGVFQTTALTLTSNTLTLASANLVMPDVSTVNVAAGDITATPTYQGEIDINYNPVADYTAGPEVPADFDGGDLTVTGGAFDVTINTSFAVNDIFVVSGTLALGANASLDGDIDNDATMDLNGNTLTYDPDGAVVDFGTITDGTILLVGNTASANAAGGETIPNLVIDATRTAAFVVNANLTVEDLTINSTVANAVQLGAFTLSVTGDLLRNDNTVGNFNALAGLLAFTGTNNALFDPGANLTLGDVQINKTDGDEVVTLDASVDVAGDFTITSGELELGDFNITMTGSGATFDNGGSFYSTTTNGYVVFENADDGGGVGVAGVAATVTGGGIFGNILVNLADAVDQVATGSSIDISGILFLNKGDFDVAAAGHTVDFTDAHVDHPTIKIVTTLDPDFTNSGTGTISYAVDVNLIYEGTADYVAGIEWSSNPTELFDITINTTGAGANAITGPGVASTASGELFVAGNAEELALGGILTLDGDAMQHTILGIVDGDLTATGNGSSIAASTTDADAKILDGNLVVNLPAVGETFTMSQINSVTGNITNTQGTSTITIADDASNDANLDGGITLTAGNLTFAMGPDGNNVEGNVLLTAGTFTLGSNLEIDGTTTQTNGAIVLGTFTLQQDGLYTDNGTGNITGTGLFDVNYAGQVAGADFTTNDLSVSNIAFSAAAAIDIVGGSLVVTGELTLNGADVEIPTGETVTLTGNTFTFDAGTLTSTGTGALVFNGGAMNADLSANFGTPIFRLDATSLSINDADDGGPYTFTVGAFTQTAGNVTLADDNSFEVTGVFTRVAGVWTMEDGFFIVSHAGPHDIGTGWVVDNLDITIATDFTDDPFTVNKVLKIANVLDVQSDNNMTLGAGATVEITADAANVVNDTPANADINALGDVNLVYSTAAAITTGFETSIASINDVDVELGTAVTLADNMTINGTLTLVGDLDVDDNNLTMADGSTIALVDQSGAAIDLTDPDGDLLAPGVLNLIYDNDSGAGVATTDNEWDDTYTIGTVSLTGDDDVLLHDDRVATGLFTIADAGNFDLNSFDLSLTGGLTLSDNGVVLGTGSLTFAGAVDQNITLDADWLVASTVELHIAVGDETTVTVLDNDLVFDDNNDATADGTLFLDSGVLDTEVGNSVVLSQSEVGGFPTQGFDRTDGHIIGNVQKRIRTDNNANAEELVANQVVIFPVGTVPASPGLYRPAIFYFTDAVPTSFILKVNHNEVDPGGENGFPITSGILDLTNYPDFFWYVQSSVPVNPSYQFDMELQAEGYTDYIEDAIENLRIIRRDSGNVNNQWRLQGSDINYDNATIATDWPIGKVIDATGGLTIQGSIFTYSQLNKLPTFTSALGNVSVNEGVELTGTFTATDPDLNQTVSVSAVSLPVGATFEAGVFTWTPTFTQAGLHTLTVRAQDLDNNGVGVGDPVDTTITITVLNVNAAPSITNEVADTTITDAQVLTHQYVVTDTDLQTPAYSVAVAPAMTGDVEISATGLLTVDPDFADAGQAFVVTVTVTDNDLVNPLTDVDVFTVTVERAVARGDADLDTEVDPADAALILAHFVEKDTITGADALWAADADQNGDITPFDAYYVLYFYANGTWPTLAKVSAAQGDAKFAQLKSDAENSIVSLPISLTGASNILSASIELNIDEKLADVKGISVNLPEGWISTSNYSNGILRIAMAGMNSLRDGDIAVVNIGLKDKEARFEVNGSVSFNNSLAKGLDNFTVKLIPNQFELSQNYPNPFNPTTKIKYQLAVDTKVSLSVYDMLGQKVASIVNEIQEAGYYTTEWNGSNDFGQKISSGVYIYRLEAGDFVKTMKMNLIK